MPLSRPDTQVVVIGTGFAGLGMAIRLRQQGMHDFVVLEKANDVGGTWRDNTYPGCACDVPSQLYSFSFAPNPEWSRSFSPQPEIWAYLQRTARDHGVLPHIRFGHDVQLAEWDDEQALWRLQTSRGPLTARVLVAGMGNLSAPSLPAIPGVESFRGTTFHSATWDHGHDLTGERVAVIGTGASAIQFVPAIQPRVGRLHLFQRTPPWVLPRADRPLTAQEKGLYQAVPPTQKLARAGIYLAREAAVLGFVREPRIMKVAEKQARRHLEQQVPDPVLRAKLQPDYTLGCKRVLLSNDYYPSLTQPNVEVVTDGIREIRAHSVVTRDGTERPVDTLIFGTGFHVTDFPGAALLRGREGRLLSEEWKDGMAAYRGTTIAGYPNLFLLVGPNTGLGHSSMVFMIESQIAYVLDALRYLRRTASDVVEVDPGAQDAYNADVQRRMKRTVWTVGGCNSWYLDEHGRNTTLWPGSTLRFRALTRRFDPAAYRTRLAEAARSPVG